MTASRNGLLLALALLSACRRSGGGDDVRVTRALDPPASIGAETAIDSVVYTDREGDQTYPFAAAGGPGGLIVWRGNSRPEFAVSELLIYAARIDANGAPLELVPAAVTAPVGESDQERAVAGWNGDHALVVLMEDLSGYQMQGARVERDGTVLDRIPFAISTTTQVNRRPIAVLPDGTGFVVLWYENGGFRIATVASNGTVAQVGGNAVALPDDPNDPTLWISGVFRVPSGLLLLLTSGHSNAGQLIVTDVKAAVINTSGALVGSVSPPVAATVVSASGMGFTGTTALAVWAQNSGTGTQTTILGRRFAADGSWIDTAPFEVRPAGGAVGQVGAVWNGTSFLCYWTDTSSSITRIRLAMRRFDANGVPIDAQPTAAVAPASEPVGSVQIIWTGMTYVAVMSRTIYTSEGGGIPHDYPDGVLARPIGANLQLGGADAVPIDTQPNTQLQYRAVGSPGGAYAVWSDDRHESNRTNQGHYQIDLYGARVTVAGASLAQTVTPLVTTNEQRGNPVIAWDGTQFTVSYQIYDDSGMVRRMLRVGASGSPVSALGGTLSTKEYGSEVVLLWNGSNFPLAWIDTYFTDARRLSGTGTVLDTQAILLPHTNGVDRQTMLGGVALNGSSLFVWQSNYAAFGVPTDEHDIEGSVVLADGTLASTTVSSIAAGTGAQDRPAIASDGASALVVWRDRTVDPQRIKGARVDARLNRVDAVDAVIAEAAAPDTFGSPVVAWTGTRYVASWTRNSGGKVTFAACPLGTDVRCQAGTETASPSNVAVQPNDTILNPSLVWTDAGGVLFYRRLDTTPNVNKERLFARAVASGGVATPPNLDGGIDGAGGAPADAGTGDARDGGAGAGGGGGAGAGGAAGTGGATGTGGASNAGGRGGAATGGGGATAGAGGSDSAGAAGTGRGGTGTGGVATGTGGTSGGSPGTGGGTGGRGGAAGGGPGTGGATAGAGGTGGSGSGGGCGCEVSGSGSEARFAAFSFLLLGLVAHRRRRRVN